MIIYEIFYCEEIVGTVVNLKDARKWLIKKDLYEFVLEMWDSYETSPYSDCWLVMKNMKELKKRLVVNVQ